MRRIARLAACVAFAAAAAPVQAAEPTPVDLALVIAVDVSASMDRTEFLLQRDGYVAAISHPDFIRAIQLGAFGRIALTYVEWSGAGTQRVLVPWRVIDGAASAAAFSDALARLPLNIDHGTSISGALYFGQALLAHSPFEATRQVIDISGDGPNNSGPPVTIARDAVVSRGVIVNGLPVLIAPSPIFPAMDRYYADCVIGGPGAFLLPVTQAEEFATAIRHKLVAEVAAHKEPPPRLTLVAGRPLTDCLIGEKARAHIDQYFPGLDD